jgi:hypothetical protein
VIAQQLVRTPDGKRCAAVEILIGGRAFSNIVREGKTSMIPSYMQSGVGEGMQTMDQALLALVNAGRIKAEDAAAKATDKAMFERLASGGAPAASGTRPTTGARPIPPLTTGSRPVPPMPSRSPFPPPKK